MGLGEKTMRSWAYAAASFCVVFGVFALVASILALVGLKGSLTESVKADAENLMIVMIVFSVIIVIVGGVAISEVYKTNQLYLRVAYKASSGKTGVRMAATVPKRTVVAPSAAKPKVAPKHQLNSGTVDTKSSPSLGTTNSSSNSTNAQGFNLFD